MEARRRQSVQQTAPTNHQCLGGGFCTIRRKDASIVTIYKKGYQTYYGNYKGISLLSIAGKVFARILLNRLSTHITPDMILCLRQLQEKCIEQDRRLYMVFVDFSKASDTVGRTGLRQLLRKYGCPEKFTTMTEALYTGIMANVSFGGSVSGSFSVTNGVKQGCVLAPTLFSIFLPVMLDEAFRHMGDGVYIQSRQSADLFNVAHFSAKTKTTRILVRVLLFAHSHLFRLQCFVDLKLNLMQLKKTVADLFVSLICGTCSRSLPACIVLYKLESGQLLSECYASHRQ